MDYLSALETLHAVLRPASYVEIGCRQGRSLALARCPSVAIDPDFEIIAELRAPTRIFRKTSDDFFAKQDLEALLGGKVDLAFVDGMHKAEFALRDILNLEEHARQASVVVVDDVLPQEMEWTTRERLTKAWTGDVYKVVPFLRKHRPDLTVRVFDVAMKGMAVITGFDPGNRTLQKNLAEHEAALAGSDFAFSDIDTLRRTIAPEPTAQFAGFVRDLRRQRGDPAPARPRADADLYLDLLKRSLLNEIYLDDEMRLLYLRDCIDGADRFDYAVLHDIRDRRSDGFAALAASRRVGRFPDRKIGKSGFSHTMMGRLRLDSLHECLDDLNGRRIPGDLVECGVWRGGGCILMAGWLKARGISDRGLVVADSFEGLPPPVHEKDRGLDLSKEKFPQLAVSLETVRANFAAYGLLDDDRQHFLKGWFRDTLKDAPSDRIAVLRMDGDLYESTMDTLVALYDRVSPGGVVIVDDYGALAMCRQAIDDFFEARKESVPAMTRIDWTGAYFTKPF
ncbi:class I SAM-dependent methyltransferase [Jiella sonneratiae]|uniref:Class I SAM-dependent methyltransferase n=1 Tax=Jiella sonneratiae TaxID=2816856 RepID=A0ABS3J069_9HYPH|nr:TylF/MycF/NovP-related O-methyltransferase [Jiella sonneratiae]MBO0903074.1 class I SAM-dependent methyltransferase [Jiella sonneratiae]